jgi:hypothetical protein
MEFKYYRWQRNDPENAVPVPSWVEIAEKDVPQPPDSRIFAVIRVYVGDQSFLPQEQKTTSYLNWDGTWVSFLSLVAQEIKTFPKRD